MNILIIDDEHELLEKLSSVLVSDHYTVETASDGREDLEKVWNDTYDASDTLRYYVAGNERT